MISYKLIVVGSCSHGIQDKVRWQCLLCLMRQQHCRSSFTYRKTQLFEMGLTSSKRIAFFIDNQRWATAISLIASLSLPLFVKFNSGATAVVPE